MARLGSCEWLKGEPCQVSEWWNETSPAFTGQGRGSTEVVTASPGGVKPSICPKSSACFRWALRAQELDLVTPPVATGRHPHASVVHRRIVHGDPGGYRGHGTDDRPQRRILVPTGNATVTRRLILYLVVPHHQFIGHGKLADGFYDRWMMNQAPIRVRYFPDIDNLPDAALRFAFSDHVVKQHGPRPFLGEPLRPGLEYAVKFVPQFLNLRIVQDSAPVEKTVPVKFGCLFLGQHVDVLFSAQITPVFMVVNGEETVRCGHSSLVNVTRNPSLCSKAALNNSWSSFVQVSDSAFSALRIWYLVKKDGQAGTAREVGGLGDFTVFTYPDKTIAVNRPDSQASRIVRVGSIGTESDGTQSDQIEGELHSIYEFPDLAIQLRRIGFSSLAESVGLAPLCPRH